MSEVMESAAFLAVFVLLVAAGAGAWSLVRRARTRSREINAQIAATHEAIAATHQSIHDHVHEINKRLDGLDRVERLVGVDHAASAVHRAASDGRLPMAAREKFLRHLEDLRDEISDSEPRA